MTGIHLVLFVIGCMAVAYRFGREDERIRQIEREAHAALDRMMRKAK